MENVSQTELIISLVILVAVLSVSILWIKDLIDARRAWKKRKQEKEDGCNCKKKRVVGAHGSVEVDLDEDDISILDELGDLIEELVEDTVEETMDLVEGAAEEIYDTVVETSEELVEVVDEIGRHAQEVEIAADNVTDTVSNVIPDVAGISVVDSTPSYSDRAYGTSDSYDNNYGNSSPSVADSSSSSSSYSGGYSGGSSSSYDSGSSSSCDSGCGCD